MPTFTLQAPDGRKLDIEAADEATAIRGAQEWARSNPAPRAKPTIQPKRGAFGEAFGAGMNLFRSIPLMDEGAAALDTGYRLASGQAHSIPEAWKQSRELQDVNADDFQARRPTATAVIKGTGTSGSMLVPGVAGLNVFAQGSRVGNMARGALTAAGTAYGYAAADKGTLAERARAGTAAAADPATLALGATAGALAPAARRPPKAKPPTLDKLTEQRKAAYADVKASGQKYTPEQFRGMVDNIKRDLAGADYDPDFQPTVATMVRKLDEKVASGYAPTLEEVDNLRKFVGKNVAGAGDKNVRRLGGTIMRSLDVSLEEAGGSEALKKARNLYGREQKVGAVTKAMDKAKRQAVKSGSGGNIDNAIRQKMDRVLETAPNLTEEERAALEDIVSGDKTRNAARAFGKTSPLAGGVPAMMSTLLALPSHGLSVAAHSVPSSVAKVAADRMTQKKVRDLIDLMAAGGTREQLRAIQQEAASIPGPAGSGLRRLVAARLAAGAGASEGSANRGNVFAQP